jgi:hypothetical protein
MGETVNADGRSYQWLIVGTLWVSYAVCFLKHDVGVTSYIVN